jgi:hypothetical protein
MDLRQKVPFFMNYTSGYIDTVTGNGSITLPKAKANGLKSVKLFGGTEQSNLQAGFTQLEYIESTGTQYIDTGLKLNQNNIVEVEYCYHTTSSITSSGRIFGARYTSSPRRSFSVGTNNGYASSATQVFSQLSDASIGGLNNIVIGQWNSYKLSADGFYINGVKQGEFAAVSTFETPFTVKLFAFEQASSSSGTPSIGCGVGRCRRFKVWNGDTLVMDLIPAKNISNEAGMYDIVSGQFFANQGTGTFAAGQDVVPTPDAPIDIISNNGVLKYSANMCNVNAQTALIGYYTSAQGVVTRDMYNWMYQAFIPVKPNTTYTLTMSSPVYYVSISEYSTAKDSGFIVRKVGNTGANTSLTITTGASTNFVRFGTNIDRTEVTLEEVLAINWMLNEGATAIPYAPYAEGGIYTDGTVETVEVTGKNLLDLANCTDGYYYDPDGVYSEASSARLSNFVQVKANETYTVFVYGLKGSANVRVNLFDTNKNWLSQQATPSTLNQYTAITVTTTQDGYLAFSANFVTTGSCIDWTVSQIIKGSYTVATMPEYEPYYNGGTATAEMLLKVGDYKDVQSVLDGAVTRNVGIKVLDGTENWTRISGSSAPFALVVNDFVSFGLAGKVIVYSSHFQGVPATAAWANYENLISFTTGTSSENRTFRVRYLSNTKTLAEFKQFLAEQYANGTPVICVYYKTPTTETVTGQHLHIQAGTNTVAITQASIDNLPLEATYKRGK